MKTIFLRAGFMACLLFMGWSYQHAYAADMPFPSKCTQYGSVQQGKNPSPQHINCLLTNAAIEENIPPEVVKAVASRESGWRQFDANGQPYQSSDGGIGIMQITNQANYDPQQLDINKIEDNIEVGVKTLANMFNRTDLPKINRVGQDVIENWYFPVMAYNGTKPVNSPLHQADGSKNTNAYQELVFAEIEKDSFLSDNSLLAQYPFKTSDFSYDPSSSNNIVFNKLEYTLTDQMHATNYLFQPGDSVVTTGSVNLRKGSDSSTILVKSLDKNTSLIISAPFAFDQNDNSVNQFVWYPVKTADQKLAGYISSAYITKKLNPPTVNPVDDNDLSLSGKAPANTLINITNGTTQIGNTTADSSGNYKLAIPVQKAGAQLTVTYMDNLNEISPAANIVVADKTPPSAPAVYTVTNKTAAITGCAEANSTVSAVIAGKIYSAKADSKSYYKIVIPIQNTGTSISVTAKDSAGNVSTAKTVTVVREAPNMPAVYTVTNKATAITGGAEANATVSAVIAGKTYTTKADSKGYYKIAIPVQNTGMSISVTAKDSSGHVSAARIAAVVREAPNMPVVYTVTNKATAITGGAEANATVSASIAGKIYSAKADSKGYYKIAIPIQNTGTSISVTAKDSSGHVSAARTITVTRVAPNMPVVNTVRYTSTTVTGKTEKYITVSVKIGSKIYSAKSNANGDFKISIPKQRTGTIIYVYATDANKQVSASRSVTVSK